MEENHRNLNSQSSHPDGEPAEIEGFQALPVPDTEPPYGPEPKAEPSVEPAGDIASDGDTDPYDPHPELGGGLNYKPPSRPHLLALCFDLSFELGPDRGAQQCPLDPFEVAFWCLAFEDVTLAYAPAEGSERSRAEEYRSPEEARHALARLAGPLRIVRA